ncbi:recombinase family protein [Lactobacillus sp. CC-MHH1034]|uniref:recombinase family protein n=1 Tax=Agrilactobacillus fermenti TaxID=2586909 RepID=UPI001E4AD4CD|nr:recombinase family protein [Agrilactobacillus fermenti]MCD2256825.1 recombinase family protein [Agrilactobacillus fermenti]
MTENKQAIHKIGYIRVSSADDRQKLGLEVQRHALEALEVDEIFEDKSSGRNDDRAAFKQAIQRAKILSCAGHEVVFVVYKLDRLARKTSTLLLTYETLLKYNIRLKSLKEEIDTSTPTGILLFQMIAIFSEFEVNNLRMLTKEGLAQAKADGKLLGRPKIDATIKTRVLELYQYPNLRLKDIARECGISTKSVYNIAKAAGLQRHA